MVFPIQEKNYYKIQLLRRRKKKHNTSCNLYWKFNLVIKKNYRRTVSKLGQETKFAFSIKVLPFSRTIRHLRVKYCLNYRNNWVIIRDKSPTYKKKIELGMLYSTQKNLYLIITKNLVYLPLHMNFKTCMLYLKYFSYINFLKLSFKATQRNI